MTCGGLAVGGRGHDQALHGLHVPVAFKFGGEPVQHVALYRLVALRSEILGGLDEAATEMELPVTVDGHARGQGMLRAEEPLGEAQTIRRGVLGHRRKHGWDAGSHLLGLIAVVAAGQNEGVARLGHLCHDLRRHDFFFRLSELGFEGVELGVDASQFGSGVAGEEVIEEALVLVFGALGFVLRQDVADGLVQGQGFGVGGSEGTGVDAQAADIALEGLIVVRVADGQGPGGHGVGLACVKHSRGLAVEQKGGR